AKAMTGIRPIGIARRSPRVSPKSLSTGCLKNRRIRSRICAYQCAGLLCREPGFEYGSMNRSVDEMMSQNRVLAAGIAGLAAGLFVPTISSEARGNESSITCTNPVSGASWQIAIDFDKATVDSNRAKITGAKISWFDPTDSGNYTLDRESGDLTATIASSTGGYFRHGRCSLGQSR